MRRTRKSKGARRIARAAALAVALMLGRGAAAQPAAEAGCAALLAPACVAALGAGAAPSDPACADQTTAYRDCLSATAAAAPAAPSGPSFCDADTAAALWTEATRESDCFAYRGFREACPLSPQARMAEAAMDRMRCAGAATAPRLRGAPGATGGVTMVDGDDPMLNERCADPLEAEPRRLECVWYLKAKARDLLATLGPRLAGGWGLRSGQRVDCDRPMRIGFDAEAITVVSPMFERDERHSIDAVVDALEARLAGQAPTRWRISELSYRALVLPGFAFEHDRLAIGVLELRSAPGGLLETDGLLWSPCR